MILDDIVEKRRQQLIREKQKISPEEMQKHALAEKRPVLDFYGALKMEGLSVIAEVKKASPSKGVIREDFRPTEFAKAYEKGGAAAISCLTEEFYFQGNSEYLKEVRKATGLPILRKDFIVDPYQIYEARVIGADAVLLIAALLDTETLVSFMSIAKSLGLHCLIEVHNEAELQSAMKAGAEIIGINNRDLKTFRVSLEATKMLAEQLPQKVVKVSESGIGSREDVETVRQYGADAVLIGETLMRSRDMAAKLRQLRGIS